MKRSNSHQIDELAQRAFIDSLPPTWVCNPAKDDYAKDYLVEIGEDDGALSGSSFFVQLKGTTRPRWARNRAMVSFSLKNNHARYYADQVRDLPVFLVVVDTRSREGWWLFVQDALSIHVGWRNQKSATLYLPIENSLSDVKRFRQAIVEAKRRMQAMHPTSIVDAIAEQKRRTQLIDPRFDVHISIENDLPIFHLSPKTPIEITMEFQGEEVSLRQKLVRLIEKGEPVTFDPGEVFTDSTALFQELTNHGGTMQWAVEFPASATILRAVDPLLTPVIREMPGVFSGGQRELTFQGGFARSPLSITAGPISPSDPGRFNVNFKLPAWDGQRLRELAYFDRIVDFCRQCKLDQKLTILFEKDGNTIFRHNAHLDSVGFLQALDGYLTCIEKARRVAEKFEINPIWSFEAFDEDAWETVEEMYDVFFCGESITPAPNVKITAELLLIRDVNEIPIGPSPAQFVSTITYEFLGCQIEAGRIVREYTDITVDLRTISQNDQKHAKAMFSGGKNTMLRVRLATDIDAE